LISIGDDVIIDTEDDTDAVGQIQELYNDDSQDEPCRVVIHWYYKIHELPPRVYDKIHQASCLSEKYELFWPVGDIKNLRGCTADIDAETIRKKCLVVVLPSETNNREDTRKYFIRFGFTIDNKLLSDSELLNHLNTLVHWRKTPKKVQGIIPLYSQSFMLRNGFFLF
jgi:hypothetical protein